MRTVKTLEGIVSSAVTIIRITPMGALATTIGPSLFAGGILFLSKDSTLSEFISQGMITTGFLFTILGPVLYACALPFYSPANRLFAYPTAAEHLRSIIEPNLREYCTRQAFHAAAVNNGFGQEFKRINSGYEGEKKGTWLPGV